MEGSPSQKSAPEFQNLKPVKSWSEVCSRVSEPKASEALVRSLLRVSEPKASEVLARSLLRVSEPKTSETNENLPQPEEFLAKA